MNIPIGSKLKYAKDDQDVEVDVCSEKKVNYKGKITSLTAVTRELLQIGHDVQPTPYWIYEGKNLMDIYNETYVNADE